MLGLTLSSNLDWGSYIISNLKTASRKTEAFILSIKLLSPNCYLNLLVKLQKRICWTVGSSLAASLEPLARSRNLSRFSLFYKYYFGRCSSELAELVPLPYSQGRYNCYSDKLYDFSVTIPYCYKGAMSTVFFLAQLNSVIL